MWADPDTMRDYQRENAELEADARDDEFQRQDEKDRQGWGSESEEEWTTTAI
jgi:hypothetical protein